MDYSQKYLKYKQKYFSLKKHMVQSGGQNINLAPIAPAQQAQQAQQQAQQAQQQAQQNAQNIDFNDPNVRNELIQQGRVIQPADVVRMMEEQLRDAPADVRQQAYENYNRMWEHLNRPGGPIGGPIQLV